MSRGVTSESAPVMTLRGMSCDPRAPEGTHGMGPFWRHGPSTRYTSISVRARSGLEVRPGSGMKSFASGGSRRTMISESHTRRRQGGAALGVRGHTGSTGAGAGAGTFGHARFSGTGGYT